MGLFKNGNPINNTPFYDCIDYGVSTLASDNTTAFQNLIDLVYENGGGTIFIPCGLYLFDTSKSTKAFSGNVDGLIQLRPNVSIIGESMDGTVLNVCGETQRGSALFVGSQTIFGEYVYGATYTNFTIDQKSTSVEEVTHRSKAFYTSGMYDCVFRDLRLLNTISTALGIDMLNNVIIDSIYCENCGRGWTLGVPGNAGIGIGTGKWKEENFIIRNCVCVGCGHFGIFLEDQGLFSTTKDQNFPKGQIIANNICRNGKNYGIGCRGGRYVNITGNNVYNNTNGGIYLDYGADAVNVSNNIVSGEVRGINFGDEYNGYQCTRIAIHSNTFVGCTNTIVKTIEPNENCVIENNIVIT